MGTIFTISFFFGFSNVMYAAVEHGQDDSDLYEKTREKYLVGYALIVASIFVVVISKFI